MLSEKNAMLGFWSYAHFDNMHDQENLVKLCQRLKGEVRAQSGQNFDVFIDQDTLHVGQQWQDELEAALERADVLIPVVTPSYFASENCHDEYDLFKDRELDFGRADLIAPIYYISCPELESKSDEGLSEWALDLRKRKYADFRFIRTGSRNSVHAAKEIEKFANSLVASLNESRSSRLDGDTDGILHLSTAESEPPESVQVVDPHIVIEAFTTLPQTQRNLVRHLYRLHKDYIGVDDLYRDFGKKYGSEAVGSPTELHYRLQVLQFQGFITLKAVGHRTTVVTTIPEVGKLLSENKLIRT
jgi:hypothetical protein